MPDRIQILSLFIICCAFAASPSPAQRSDVKFQQLSVEDGLSQITVYSIVQDYKGFLWFATKDGLNRFDGYDLTVYRHTPFDENSLSDNLIQTMYTDSSAVLWIGTKGGLNKLDLQTDRLTRYLHDPQNPNSLSNDYVWAIEKDGFNALWIGTDGGGLNKFSLETGKFIRYKNDPSDNSSLSNDYIRCIYEDRSGTLWIGTLNGLNKFDPATNSFVRYRNNPSDPKSLSNNVVMDILEDASGTLWIGTLGGGLNIYDRAIENFSQYGYDAQDPGSLSDDRISSIYQDQNGTLWVGTLGGGLNCFDGQSGSFTRYRNDPARPASLSHDAVWAILEDFSGTLWVGTLGGGLNKIAPLKKFHHFTAAGKERNSLNNPFIRAIFVDHQNMVWVGTYGGGLNRLDRRTGVVTVFKNDPSNPRSLSHNVVWSIYEDRQGTLWIGTRGGLNLFDRHTESFVRIKNDPDDERSLSDNVSAFFEDSRGAMWIGTFEDGLHKFDRTTFQAVRYRHDPHEATSLSHNSIFCIYEDHAGTLWIGTDGGGLNRFDRDTGRFERFTSDPHNPRSLSHNAVRSIHEMPAMEDEGPVLWIGTSQGLNRFNPQTGEFVQFFEKDGLPNAVIYGVLGDDHGNLWMSTNNGVCRFNERLPDKKRFQNFDVRDGLQGNEFNTGAYHKSRDGEMFLGGFNGFNCFYPDEIRSSLYVPPVVLTAFRKFGEAVKLDSAVHAIHRIELSYRENFFSFEFAALDYAAPERNRYAYRLQGFDEHWINAGTQRHASYTNLDGGDYVFHVKGSNHDGVWNEAGAAIAIRIVPPFWATAWFRAFMVLSLIGLAVLIYQMRVKQLKHEKSAQEAFSRRLIEFQEKERKRIAAELHDGFGQSLLIIRNGLQRLLQSVSRQEAGAEEIQQLSEMTLQSINEVREISSNLHPHQLDRLGLKKAVEAVVQKFSQSVPKLVSEIDDIDGLFPRGAEINVYRIIQEGLGNVVKHAAASEAAIQVKRNGRLLDITITDNGKGFDVNNVHQDGFGLANISERARILHGKIQVKSSPGRGTVLAVQIPI